MFLYVKQYILCYVLIMFSFAFVSCEVVKEEMLDRGAHGDRNGLWFGPRLGKRSLNLAAEDNGQKLLRLLEAAENLKYYYDQLPYESRVDEPKVIKKVIFTPKLGRSLEGEEKRSYENVEFTPRLGRRLASDAVTTPDQDISNRDRVDIRSEYFSPRLGRTVQFSPRLGRELAYDGFIITIDVAQGYVLLAANVQDLNKIANYITPNNILKFLNQITSDPNKRNRKEDENSEIKDERIDTKNETEYGSDKKRSFVFPGFEEPNLYLIYDLAEKIKQRIINELALKFMKIKHGKQHLEDTENDHTKVIQDRDKKDVDERSGETIIILKPIELSEIIKNEKSTGTGKSEKQLKHFYDEINSIIKLPNSKITKNFKNRIKMTTNRDRTEKFITHNHLHGYHKPVKLKANGGVPDKHQKNAGHEARMYKNIFHEQLAKTKTDFKMIRSNSDRKLSKNPFYVTFVKHDEIDDDHENNDDEEKEDNLHEENDGSDEVKTSTSYLSFDDDANDTMIITENWINDVDIINTMKPKLQGYSMTTPNYYSSTTVAERYNYKEPLPDGNMKRTRMRWVKKFNGKY